MLMEVSIGMIMIELEYCVRDSFLNYVGVVYGRVTFHCQIHTLVTCTRLYLLMRLIAGRSL